MGDGQRGTCGTAYARRLSLSARERCGYPAIAGYLT